MGLIKKMSEEIALRKEEKLILREMAQERLTKKRALAEKQKEFDSMLDMRLPCEHIIDLKNKDGEVQYFLMDMSPVCAILFLQEGIYSTIKFKQLTGKESGKVYEESKYATSLYGALTAMEKGYSVGLFNLSKSNRGHLSVAINGYRNYKIEQHFGEKTELEKIYGKTMTLRQLLMRWKTDNGRFMNINIDEDYEMVKRVYDSEDILAKSKSEELSK